MPEVPPDILEILDIAAVVTGAKQLPLTGWQRDQAIHAMCALGYTTEHIADSLTFNTQTVQELARNIGAKLNRRDRSDPTAIEYVLQGTQMRLTGTDRDEAIRQLATRGKTCSEIAALICATSPQVSAAASRLGVRLPRKETDWWVVLAQPSRSSEIARAYKQRRKQLTNA